MALADAAVGVNRTIQQMLVDRELAKRQAIKDELAQMQLDRQNRTQDLQERQLVYSQSRNEKLDADKDADRASAQEEKAAQAEQYKTFLGSVPASMRPVVEAKKYGINATLHDFEDPEAHQAHLTADEAAKTKAEREKYEFQEGLKTSNRLKEIGAQGSEQRRTAAANDARKPTAGGKPGDGSADAYASERAQRALESVKALKGKVSNWTVGPGSILAGIPGTDAKDFAAELNTLKSAIIQNELSEMRQASKTGGALGPVSDYESRILASSLGALEQDQSPRNLSVQLQKIEDSLTRWQAAKGLRGAPGSDVQVTGTTAAALIRKYGGK